MFYGAFVLAKKGPLAKVWLAAHWDKKLTKAHVFETDVESTVDSIISPQVKMALRTSGHLLLGVVRIYSRKQKYLIHDLGEACAKIKMAFRPGIVDLPSDNGAENADAITLPEIFHDFETSVANLETLHLEAQFTVNPSRASEITIAEDPTTTAGGGDIFGEYNDFDLKDGEFGSGMEDIEVKGVLRNASKGAAELGITDKNIAQTSDLSNGTTSLRSETRLGGVDGADVNQLDERVPDAVTDFGGIGADDLMGGEFADLDLPQVTLDGDKVTVDNTSKTAEDEETEMEVDPPQHPKTLKDPIEGDQSTVVQDPTNIPAEEEGFVLEPLRDADEKRVARRKRRLVVDTNKEFTGQQIKSQFDDYKDLLQPKYFPPPTKKAMRWKEMAGCDQLFSNPTNPGLGSELRRIITRNYSTDVPGNPATENIIELDNLEVSKDLPEIEKVAGVSAAENDASVVDLNVNISDDTHQESRGDVDIGGSGDDMRQVDFDNGMEGLGELNEETTDTTTKVIPDMVELEDYPAYFPEEQQGEESTEEFEQRRWTKRTQQVLHILQRSLDNSDQVQFSLLTQKCNRKQAASRFYTCLLLAKEGMISVEQPEPYAEILLQRGPKFTEA